MHGPSFSSDWRDADLLLNLFKHLTPWAGSSSLHICQQDLNKEWYWPKHETWSTSRASGAHESYLQGPDSWDQPPWPAGGGRPWMLNWQWEEPGCRGWWPPWAEKGEPCTLLVCCTFPNHKARLGASLPRLIAICHAIRIVIACADTRSALWIPRVLPWGIMPLSKAGLSGHSGAFSPSVAGLSAASPLTCLSSFLPAPTLLSPSLNSLLTRGIFAETNTCGW